MSEDYKIINGNSLEELDKLPENSVGAIITDPPYELGFMGKKWDSSGIAYNVELWKKALRVLKPGGYLAAFGGSRTFHRVACAIEDAGFEIRDTMMWLYGSGFPKSMNVGLAIDKMNGVDNRTGRKVKGYNGTGQTFNDDNYVWREQYEERKAQNEWAGYGTCLKPAHEDIIVARKPIEEGSVAANCLKWGVGAINIDECRVPLEEGYKSPIRSEESANNQNQRKGQTQCDLGKQSGSAGASELGRFPANIITDGSEEVAKGFPEGAHTGNRTQTSINNCIEARKVKKGNSQCDIGGNIDHITEYTDTGSAMRYFYTAKASKKDRDDGLDMFENKSGAEITGRKEGSAGLVMAGGRQNPFAGAGAIKKNFHPTVKPVELMQYLVRLFTPKGETILDIFNGSGSTGKAVAFENRERNANYKYIGIELNKDYCEISKARIDYAINKYEYEFKKEQKEMKEKGQMLLFEL